MRIACWNCRGAEAPEFPKVCKEMIQTSKIDILILMETRVMGKRVAKIIKRLGYTSAVWSDTEGFAGGIWAL